MKINNLTPDASILEELGKRLSRVRKQQGLTQEKLAAEAGVGVATLRRIEDGNDGQLGSWLKIMKALKMAATLDAFVPETFKSPMAEVLAEKKRSRPKKTTSSNITWGDEKL